MAGLPYAWLGDVQTFLDTPEDELLRRLTSFAKETGAPQVFAWDRTLRALRDELGACLPDAARFALVLEFEVPRSGGRRPDLIILENGTVLVIEFKNRVEAEPADIDQVLGYARELADYHAGCHERLLIPVLVPIGLDREPSEQRGVHVVPPSGLADLIRRLAKTNAGRPGDAHAWVNAPYAPLPALAQAARLLFERQPLPQIKRAESAKIPEALAFLEAAIQNVRTDRDHLLAIVTGVPGSGKTLLGLQLAHSRRLEVPTIFLSGNGPLVQVLRYSLGRGAHAFVQDMRAFLKQHGGSGGGTPPERVVIFDEAQRAWDRDRVLQRHQGQLAASEPQLLVEIGHRVTDGFALVVLIGEGQEIHTGEESGIGQWADAVKHRGWNVIGPPHLAATFGAAGVAYRAEPLLGLTTSLRSHRASDVALWTGLLLEGRLDEAHDIAAGLKQAGFVLRVSRHLGDLQQYARDRYHGEPSKRFGLIASSKFRTLSRWGVRTARHPYWYYGQWFEAAPTDPHSGCQLEMALSEFGCQGLELDFPLVCWGPDCRWDRSAWVTRTGRVKGVRDPHRLRLNAYRVLLTRGRDGVAVFVPRDTDMDSTFVALCRAGFEPFS
jgi:Uncharacterized conserved protein (DUF2075)